MGRTVFPSDTLSLVPRHLLGRLYLFAAVLSLDCVLVALIPHTMGLLGPLAPFGIVSFAVFLGLGYSRLEQQKEELPFGFLLFGAHLVCIAANCARNEAALHGLGSVLDTVAAQFAARAVLLVGIALLALACIPLRSWIAMIRATRPLWLFASLAGASAWGLRYPFQSLWDATGNGLGRFLQILTFNSVHAVLHFFIAGIVVDADTFSIGTPRFAVFIAKQCSGMEGLGLVLVFTIVWLSYFRRESRFPQALLLIPCALVTVWLLNVVRICALILIGDAGAEEVAMVGFHSQAGWIAFTTVAFAFSMATRKLSWIRRPASSASHTDADLSLTQVGMRSEVAMEAGQETGESPATRAYLVPFLAILAASLVSKAASGYFEWLYPLRFIAAAIGLWFFRAELRKLNWRFGWFAPLTGAAIFLVWIVPAFWIKAPSASPLGTALAGLPTMARLTWIAFRVAAAAVTVPIAEELAFRGYLARRLIHREFDAVPFSNLTILSIAVSSVIFGLLHGQHWITGILAGLAYAAVLKRRGRIGDAVVAHATSNLLLAALVLLRGDWAQW
jgi:exosortase E/protease (VPEID-CTERM system)